MVCFLTDHLVHSYIDIAQNNLNLLFFIIYVDSVIFCTIGISKLKYDIPPPIFKKQKGVLYLDNKISTER